MTPHLHRRPLVHLVIASLPMVLFIMTLLLACTSINCPIQNKVTTQYALRKPNGTADSLRYDTLWISIRRADGQDTLLLNGHNGASTFSMPISHTQPEDVLYVELGDTNNVHHYDTIRILKENIPHFESVDCQAAYFHLLTSVLTTHHIIDSVIINNPNVTYDPQTVHLHLYIKADR